MISARLSFTYDGQSHYMLFHAIDDPTVDANSVVTTHPVANGDIIADHVYDEPKSVRISGTVDLKPNSFETDSGLAIKSFKEFEAYIEKLKTAGTIFKYTKVLVENSNAKELFESQMNIVLTSATFTERINSLGISFSFTEIKVATVKQDEYVVTTEQYVPTDFSEEITQVKNVSSEILINTDALRQAIRANLTEGVNIGEKWYKYCYEGTGVNTVAVGAAAIGGSKVGGWIGTIWGPIGNFIGEFAGAIVGALIAISPALIDAIGAACQAGIANTSFGRAKSDRMKEQLIDRLVDVLDGEVDVLRDNITAYELPLERQSGEEQVESMLIVVGDKTVEVYIKKEYDTSASTVTFKDADTGRTIGPMPVSSANESFLDTNLNDIIIKSGTHSLYMLAVPLARGHYGTSVKYAAYLIDADGVDGVSVKNSIKSAIWSMLFG